MNRPARRWHFRSLFSVIGLLVLAGPIFGGAARDELLRLVPEDVGFCLVIQDLRGHSEAFLGSAFASEFRQSPLGQALQATPEAHKLLEVRSNLQSALGIDWSHLRDDILGDAVVLAYRPGPAGQPEQDEGILLIRARDAQRLARFVEHLNAVQRQSGELLELQTRKYHGVTYTGRVGAKETNYYYLQGPVLAFGPKEGLLHQVIDRERGPAVAEEPLITRQLRRLNAADGLAALWINPRVFEQEIERQAAQANGAEAVVRKAVVAYWKALDGIVLALVLGRTDVEVNLGFLARGEQLPLPGRRLFRDEGKPSELWGRFPAHSFLTIAGRFETGSAHDFLQDFLTADARKALQDLIDHGVGAAFGKDTMQNVLSRLGPDWGFCVTAPPQGPEWFPHALWALRVQSSKEVAADRTLLDALNMVALFAVLAYNSNHSDQLALKAVRQDHVEIKYLTNEHFPLGLQPAFALKDGYLLIASSPEAIRAFRTGAAATSSGSTAGENLFLRLSLRELSRYLKDRRDVLTAHAASKLEVSPEEASRRLDYLLDVLRLFDRLELSHRAGSDQFALILRLHTQPPLRK